MKDRLTTTSLIKTPTVHPLSPQHSSSLKAFYILNRECPFKFYQFRTTRSSHTRRVSSQAIHTSSRSQASNGSLIVVSNFLIAYLRAALLKRGFSSLPGLAQRGQGGAEGARLGCPAPTPKPTKSEDSLRMSKDQRSRETCGCVPARGSGCSTCFRGCSRTAEHLQRCGRSCTRPIRFFNFNILLTTITSQPPSLINYYYDAKTPRCSRSRSF